MKESYSPHHPNDVLRSNRLQYESLWTAYASARRSLYPYEIPPWEIGQRPPYDMWEDIAEKIEQLGVSKIHDIGANDGHLHSVMRQRGYQGGYIGLDISESQLILGAHLASLKWPGSETEFRLGDASDMRGIFEDNSAQCAVAAFVPYHMHKPYRLFAETHRITEPGGINIFATRGAANQLDTWQVAGNVAHSFNFAFPREIGRRVRKTIQEVPAEEISIYSNFDIHKLHTFLEQSKKFDVIFRGLQHGKLWIPVNKEGFFDYARAVESLMPYTVSLQTGEAPTASEMGDFASAIYDPNGPVYKYLAESGRKTMRSNRRLDEPYHVSFVSQAYFVAKVIKRPK